jgi:hypothetical protein
MDAANLLGSSLTWIEMDVDRARRLEPAIIEGYLEGLNEMGWAGDHDHVLLGYLAVAAARAAGASLFPVTWVGDTEWRDLQVQSLHHTPDELTDHWIEVFEWVFPRFKAAVGKAGI